MSEGLSSVDYDSPTEDVDMTPVPSHSPGVLPTEDVDGTPVPSPPHSGCQDLWPEAPPIAVLEHAEQQVIDMGDTDADTDTDADADNKRPITPRPKKRAVKDKGNSQLRRSQRPVKRNSKFFTESSENEDFQLDTPIIVRLSDRPSFKSVSRTPSKGSIKKPKNMTAVLEEKDTGLAEERMKVAQGRSVILTHLRTDLENFARYLDDGKRVSVSH